MPRVSVNICCYNSERFLDETIQSVLKQTYKDWELVFVNDGSTDRTEEIIQAYVRQGWPITYHYQPNSGLGASRNKALQLSKGQYIAFLDHDDIWLPQKLKLQMAFADEHPEVALIFSNSFFIDEEGEIIRDGETIRTMLSGHDISTVDLSPGNGLNELLIRGCFIDVESVVVRKDVFDTVGLFNASYSQVEDYDMWLRIAGKFQMGFINEPLCKWRIHAGQATQTLKRQYFTEHIDLYRRWMNHPQLDNAVRTIVQEKYLRKLNEYSQWLQSKGIVWEALKNDLELIIVQPFRLQSYKRLAKQLVRTVLCRN